MTIFRATVGDTGHLCKTQSSSVTAQSSPTPYSMSAQQITTSPYAPLVPCRKAIRVLDLSPGRLNDELCGSLRIVFLDTASTYEALSYTWGPATECKSICISKAHNISITDNLFKALRRLRRRFLKRTLWVDAICINQSDVQERGQQVQIMGDVYRQALRVLVWLGEYEQPSMSDSWYMRRPHLTNRGNTQVINERGRRFATALDTAIRDSTPQWLDRAWVIQEFVQARERVLCFGPVSLPHNPTYLIDLLMLSSQPLQHLRAFHERSSDMVKLAYGIGGKQQSIAEAILFTSDASCSNPRDKVYSLLSLIDGEEASRMTVDYEQTCAQTFAKATFAAISAQDNFAILELVGFDCPSVDNRPTWAVDFTLHQSPSEGRIHQMIDIDNSSQPWLTSARRPSIDMDAKYLTAAGYTFDHVTMVLTMPTTIAAASGTDATKVAESMASLLQNLAHKDRVPGGLLSFLHVPIDAIRPSHFLLYGQGTQVQTVIQAAFAFWNELTGFSDQQVDTHAALLWECDARERIRRVEETHIQGIATFLEYTVFASGGCVMFATAGGFLGLAPTTVELGDPIILLRHSKFPVILRPSRASTHAFKGFTCVHGIPSGELIEHGWETGNNRCYTLE